MLGEDVGRLKASWVYDMVERDVRLLVEDEENRLDSQFICQVSARGEGGGAGEEGKVVHHSRSAAVLSETA